MSDSTPPRRPSVLAVLSLAVGLAAIPAALAAHSVVELVDNTEYVANSLEPLIDDPAVQDQLVDSALAPLTEVFTSEAVIDLLVAGSGLPGPLLDPLDDAAQAFIQPLVDSITTQIEQAASAVVATPAFAESWRTAIGDSHRSFQDALTSDGEVAIELPITPFLDLIRDDLVNRGFGALDQLIIPELSVPLFDIDPPDSLRNAYFVASTLDPWLALLAIGLTGVGVWFSPRRQVAWIAVGVATPLLTVAPTIALQAWLGSQEQTFPLTIAHSLMNRPIDIAWTLSVVVALIATTGWFVERRRAKPIA